MEVKTAFLVMGKEEREGHRSRGNRGRLERSDTAFSCILKEPAGFLRKLVTDILQSCRRLDIQDPRWITFSPAVASTQTVK